MDVAAITFGRLYRCVGVCCACTACIMSVSLSLCLHLSTSASLTVPPLLFSDAPEVLYGSHHGQRHTARKYLKAFEPLDVLNKLVLVRTAA